jgi:hypothetical protein
MKSATMVLFWKRSDVQSQLSLMEVTNVDGDEQEFTGWYYIHRVPCAVYRYDRPQSEMKYGAEWKDDNARSYAAPAEKLKPNLQRMMDHYDAAHVELIYAGFNLETNGKVPRRVCEAADAWLRKAARDEPQCLKALSYPSEVERSKAKKL